MPGPNDQKGGWLSGLGATISNAQKLLQDPAAAVRAQEPVRGRDVLTRAQTEREAKAQQIQDMAGLQALKTGKPVPQAQPTDIYGRNPYGGAMAVAANVPISLIGGAIEGIQRFGQTAISPITGEEPSIDLNSEEGTAEVVLAGMGYSGATLGVRGAIGGSIDRTLMSAGGASDGGTPPVRNREVIDYDLKDLTNSPHTAAKDLDYSEFPNTTGKLIKNPNQKDILALGAGDVTTRDKYPNGVSVRAIEDTDGNIYAWSSLDPAIHYDIEEYLAHQSQGKAKIARTYYIEKGKDGKLYNYNEPDPAYDVEDYGKPYNPNPVQQQQANAGGGLPPDTIGVTAPPGGELPVVTDELLGRRATKNVANDNVKDTWPPEARMLRAAWEDRLSTVQENLTQARDDLATLRGQKTPSIKDIRETEALIGRYEDLEGSYIDALKLQDEIASKGFPDEVLNTPEMDAEIEAAFKEIQEANDAENQPLMDAYLQTIYEYTGKQPFMTNRMKKAGVRPTDLLPIFDALEDGSPKDLKRLLDTYKGGTDERAKVIAQFIEDIIQYYIDNHSD